jgi:hypothetical protein
VKWNVSKMNQYFVDEATWENEIKFKANLPDFCYWGQWPLFGGGIMLTTKGGWWGQRMKMKNFPWKFKTRGDVNEIT